MFLHSLLDRFLPSPTSPSSHLFLLLLHSLVLHLPFLFSSSYSSFPFSPSPSPFHHYSKSAHLPFLLSLSSLSVSLSLPHACVRASRSFPFIPIIRTQVIIQSPAPFLRGHTLAFCTALGYSLLSPSLPPSITCSPPSPRPLLTEHNNSGVGELSRAEPRNASFVKGWP